MSYGFLDIAVTPAVKAVQAANNSLDLWDNFKGDRAFDRFTDQEVEFIGRRDSFYMATVSENGWPYVQHRGGPQGFLRVLDGHTLAFADFSGNRQYLSVGNLSVDDRVALILVDYPARRRLKILAHVELRDPTTDLILADLLTDPDYRGKIERLILMKLVTFDWNCPQHITPRFPQVEVSEAVLPLRERISQLEQHNKVLEAKLSAAGLDFSALDAEP